MGGPIEATPHPSRAEGPAGRNSPGAAWTMDENGITNVFDRVDLVEVEPSRDAPAPPIYLIVVDGGIPGAMLRLGSGGTRLGRAPDNVLQLPESSVSRYHAYLKADEDGMVRLTDLGSTNGTFLNGERVAEHIPVVLRDGDRLRFGSSMVLKFARPDPCEERFQREMFDRAVRDPLTGLYNRAFFLDQVGPLGDRGQRKGLGLAILLLDVDHFKRVNDTYGHAAGDVALREVAAVLRQATRAEDLVARYGGEEFVLALPVAAPDLAAERAERVRRALAARRIFAEGHPLRITASIGLAYSPAQRPIPPATLIDTADRHLYRAKDAGRNRVIGPADPPPTTGHPIACPQPPVPVGRQGHTVEL